MSRISDREAAILGLLCERSRYGYELEKIIEERGMRVWTEIGFSSIYYVLNKLEIKGYISSTVKEVEGKPSRRVYTVTDKGVLTMKEKIKSVLSLNKKTVSPFDLGIAYHYLLKPEEVLECLRLYLESLDKRRTALERSIREKQREGANYRVIALFSRPLAHVNAERLWVEQFIKEVERRDIDEENS
ncbi:MAG: PadR family transcriptional regulator [Theionarchaea archaeon]|nr:PadR family transcriptional regulator [Theionarchaea archaeon]